MTTTIIGLDIARTVLRLHAEDASGRVLDRKRLTRGGLVKVLRPARADRHASPWSGA